MSISMYAISVPVFLRHLNGIAGCLKKARALYAEKKYDETTLIHYRLYPDMFHFARQVQAMCDHAKTCTALLAGVQAPQYEDDEKSLAELVSRIEKTAAFVSSIGPEQLEGAEERTVSVKVRDRTLEMKGLELLLERSLPNFFFHATTAYDILRHNGVEIGKRDFMGMA
jgi:hypothetical protein